MLQTFLVAGGLVLAVESHAVISYSGGTYSQNFDSLAVSGTANAWANDTTINGWSLINSANAAIATYRAGTGSDNAGNFYSYGASGLGERALGGLGSGGAYFGSPASGAAAGWIALGIQNTSLSTLGSFTLDYAGEQWRDGGLATGTTVPSAQTMVVEYGFGSSFAAVSSWIPAGSSFNFTSPVFVNTAGGAAVNGNGVGRISGIGGTITGLTWNNGDSLWLRWIEKNDPNNDHGLAIDDLTFSAAKASVVVPEASTWVAGLGLSLGMLGTFVRKYRK